MLPSMPKVMILTPLPQYLQMVVRIMLDVIGRDIKVLEPVLTIAGREHINL
jgi:hypothetical protein